MGTEVQTYEPNAVVGSMAGLKALLNSPNYTSAVAGLASKALPPEKLFRLVQSAASRNPRLLQCTGSSILKSAMDAATLGLDCSGLLGQGYMVPYKNGALSDAARRPVYECNFQPGYLGLIELVRRSKEVKDIRAVAVYQGDEFSYSEGLNPHLTHVPAKRDPRDPPNQANSILYCYAIAEFKDGYQKFKVLTVGEIEYYRSKSKSAKESFWSDYYLDMCLKTVVRRLVKWLPMSVEVQTVLAAEDAVELNVGIGDTEAIPVSHQLDSPASRKLRGEEAPPVEMERQPATQDDTPKHRGRRTKAEMEAARAAEEAAKVREANKPAQPDPGANKGPSDGKPGATTTAMHAPVEIDDVVQGVEDRGDTLWVILGRLGRVQVTDPMAFDNAVAAKGRAVHVIGRTHLPTKNTLVSSIVDLADIDDGREPDENLFNQGEDNA